VLRQACGPGQAETLLFLCILVGCFLLTNNDALLGSGDAVP